MELSFSVWVSFSEGVRGRGVEGVTGQAQNDRYEVGVQDLVLSVPDEGEGERAGLPYQAGRSWV